MWIFTVLVYRGNLNRLSGNDVKVTCSAAKMEQAAKEGQGLVFGYTLRSALQTSYRH